MKRILTILALLSGCTLSGVAQQRFHFGTESNPQGVKFEVDSRGFIIGGERILPVMGEIHYARVPQEEWRQEIRKMKAGGITLISTYVFWIHHEAEEGRWDWSGNKNLRRFVQTCHEEGMPVVLRIGPFCHGEVYQGGFPVWVVDNAERDKAYKLRSEGSGFLEEVRGLYSNIFAQINGLQWKDGGPIVGIQIENECRGPWSYYMALKNMAVKIGFDTPFYTRTGWPKLNGKEEFGQMLPLYGDYADGFWDRKLDDMPGDYPKAFLFKDTRLSGVIATETFGTNQDTNMERSDLDYPYLTCELGGGMMPAYHRRINMNGNEPLPLAICKVGSGSNLPGYYMYHGGTNPQRVLNADGSLNHPMSECQASRTTAHNDLPQMSYDFQSPLGEMGQTNEEAWHQTRWFHQFLKDWGSELSVMDVDTLSDHYARRGSFEFRNDYVRILNEGGVASVTPYHLMLQEGVTINTATVQPFAKADDAYYFITIKGQRPSLTINGKRYSMRLDTPKRIAGCTFTVLSTAKAKSAYVIDGKMEYAKHGGILYKDGNQIKEEYWTTHPTLTASISKVQDAGAPRAIGMGGAKVAEQPKDADFDAAAIYSIDLGKIEADSTANAASLFLRIGYKGDCARVYADGILVEDNFWNGKPMLVRIADLIGKKIELRILPLAKSAPIYLQSEQRAILDAAPSSGLLSLDDIAVMSRETK